MSKKTNFEPPLKIRTYRVTTHEGTKAEVDLRQRGFLRDINVRKIQQQRQNGPTMSDGRAELTALTDRLRAHLDSAGLATDKWEVMPLGLDVGYDPEEHGYPNDDDLWHDYNMEASEPLSQDQIASSLLHSTNRLLRSLTDEQLSEAFRAMQLFHLSELVGEINGQALLGARAKAGRARGPAAKKARGDRMREIIIREAEKCWAVNPELRSRRDITAQKIFDAVNAARHEEMLGKKQLSAKGIYGYLLEASEAE